MKTSTHVLKSRIAPLGLAAALLTGLAFLTGAAGSAEPQDDGAYRLGGAWIGSNPGGNIWTAVQTPLDPAGRTAGVRISLPVYDTAMAGLLTSVGADSLSDAVGELRMDHGNYAAVFYLMQRGNPPVRRALAVLSGTWQFLGPDRTETTYTISVYAVNVPGFPNADADGDGFPDPGSVPIVSVPGVDTARRVSVP